MTAVSNVTTVPDDNSGFSAAVIFFDPRQPSLCKGEDIRTISSVSLLCFTITPVNDDHLLVGRRKERKEKGGHGIRVGIHFTLISFRS
jgi:hypothetical protein